MALTSGTVLAFQQILISAQMKAVVDYVILEIHEWRFAALQRDFVHNIYRGRPLGIQSIH
jgi:hypothetical protein